jgi:hypothetical protein
LGRKDIATVTLSQSVVEKIFYFFLKTQHTVNAAKQNQVPKGYFYAKTLQFEASGTFDTSTAK